MSGHLLLLSTLLLGAGTDAANPDYRKWIEEEVVYIISRTEKREFQALKTDAERASFVARFWKKRDPDPTTEHNPFREEHYRRLEFANQKFTDGRPGWRTDRGRVYIIHGPPDKRLVFAGSELQRKRELDLGGRTRADAESGYSGVTISVPESELWTYRPRLAPDRIAQQTDVLFMRVAQSDVLQLLTVRRPGQRVIDRNQYYSSGLYRGQGGAGRDFRIVYAGRPRFNSGDDFYRALEQSPNSFQPPEMAQVQAELLRSPGDLLEKELQQRHQLRQAVETAVYFDTIDFSLETWFTPAPSGYTEIPLALHLPPQAIAGSRELVVVVQARRGQSTAAEILDQVNLPGDLQTRREGYTYQSRLQVRPGPHQIEVSLLDRSQGRVGRLSRTLTVPALSPQEFALSPLFLGGAPRKLEPSQVEGGFSVTWMGPWRIDQWLLAPRAQRKFRRKDVLTVLFEVYSPKVNNHRPNVEIQWNLLKDGRAYSSPEIRELDHLTRGATTKLSYAISLSLAKLPRGRYQLAVQAKDLNTGSLATRQQTFEVF